MFLGMLSVSGQNYQIEKSLTTEDGLPSNETYASFFDEIGDLWILTDKGLVRYDGLNLKIFSEIDGLPSQSVFKHYKDNWGRVWFTTDKGVFYLQKGRIVTPEFNSKIAHLSSTKIINSLYLSEDNNLYISLEKPGSGYLVCNIKTNNVIFHKMGVVPNHMFQQISENVWSKYYFLGSKSHIKVVGAAHQQKDSSLLDKEKILPILLETPPPNYHRKFGVASNAKREAELFFLHTSLYVLKCKDDKIISEKVKDFGNDILSVTIYGKKIYVSCRNSGVFILNRSDYSTETKIDIRNVSHILPISNSKLWLTTLDQGVIFINTTFKLEFLIPKEFNINVAASPIYFNGSKLKLYHNKQFYFFDYQNGLLLQNKLDLPQLYRFPTQQRITWIGEDSAYFANVIVNYRSGKLKELINRNGYNHLKKLENGNYCLYGKEGFCFTDKHFNIFKQSDSLDFKKNVFSFIESKYSKGLYFATTNGVHQFLNNKVVKLFPDDPFNNARMTCLAEYKNSIIIGSYGNGLAVLQSKFLTKFSVKDGLSSNFIQAVKVVGDSIWIGTNRGLDLLFRNKKTKAWLVQSNLLNISVNHIYNLPLGLYVQSSNAFYRLSNLSAYSPYQSRKPHLVFTSLKTDQLISNPKIDNIRLMNNQRSISFQFRLDELINPKRQEYIFNLLGLNNDWINTSERSLSFNNLPFGKYTLQIKGRSSSGRWSKMEQLHFEVVPLFYQRKWFQPVVYVLLGLILGGVALLFQRERAKRYAHQNTMLRSSLSALKLQINPHFIFNALNSLQYLIISENKRKSTDFLGKFSHLVRDVLDNSQKTYITLSEEIERLKTYVKLEEVRMENDPIDFEIVYDKSLSISTILIPNMLLQPLVENAIWHGLLHLHKTPKIVLKYYTNLQQQLVIEIMDNGKGIDLKQLQAKQDSGSLAIKNIEERLFLFSTLEKKKFTIRFEATSPGTKVTITLPLKMTKK